MLRSGTARTASSDEARGQQSLGDLVGLALKDISQLVRYEIKLAKSEFKVDVRRAGIGAGAVGFILMVAYPMLFMLLFAEAYGLHAAFGNQPLWLCFIYSAATCLLFAIIVGLIGFASFKRITGMKLTRKTVSDDISMLKHAASGDADGTPAIAATVPPETVPRETVPPEDRALPETVPPETVPPENQAADTVPSENKGPAAVTAGSLSAEVTAVAMPTEPIVQIRGPWTHRSVTANGTRFHVASSGEGPLVLLLHGFPEFWWAWRHQLTALAEAGYRAVAPDLRGYGGSDKPPRGYDLITAAADAAGLIRSLGEANAVVVGHDWGGLVAWTLASYFPKSVRRAAIVSAAHPLQVRRSVLSSPLGGGPPFRLRGRGNGHPLAFQVPMFPERALVRDSASLVTTLLSSWSAPGWPDEEAARVYRRAMRIPSVAHCSLEYHRWFVRSTFRPDGYRYARQMRIPTDTPTLHLHGSVDPCVPAAKARGAGRYVDAPYRWKVLEGAGHFPHEELPDAFGAELLGWLADPEPDR